MSNLTRFLNEVSIYLDARSKTAMSRRDKELQAVYKSARDRYESKEIAFGTAIDLVVECLRSQKETCPKISFEGTKIRAPKCAQSGRLYRALRFYEDTELRNWASFFPSVTESLVREMVYIRQNFLMELYEKDYVELVRVDGVDLVNIKRSLYDHCLLPWDLNADDYPLCGNFKKVFSMSNVQETRNHEVIR